MVKHENFKTCDQSGFCKRNRLYADSAGASVWASPYQLDPNTINFENGQLGAVLMKHIESTNSAVELPITISFLESGTARITVDEERRRKGDIVIRHNSKARKERYNEAASWAIVGDLTPSHGAALSGTAEKGTTTVRYGPASRFEAVVHHTPFGIEFKRDGETHIQLNDRGLLNVEHWRQEIVKEKKEGEEGVQVEGGEDESTWWDESFGGNTDTKPRGPESVALDISFRGYEHVYGIPEHASSMALKETR